MLFRRLLGMVIGLYSLTVYGQSTLHSTLHFQNLNYYNPAAGLNRDTIRHALTLYGQYRVTDNPVGYKPLTVYANYILGLARRPGFYSIGLVQDPYSTTAPRSMPVIRGGYAS